MQIVAFKVRTKNDTSGNPRRGWLLHLVAGDQAQYIGFVSESDYPNWSTIRKAFDEQIAYLGDVETTLGEYRRLNHDAQSPAVARRIADAMDGN